MKGLKNGQSVVPWSVCVRAYNGYAVLEEVKPCLSALCIRKRSLDKRGRGRPGIPKPRYPAQQVYLRLALLLASGATLWIVIHLESTTVPHEILMHPPPEPLPRD